MFSCSEEEYHRLLPMLNIEKKNIFERIMATVDSKEVFSLSMDLEAQAKRFYGKLYLLTFDQKERLS